MTNLETRQGLRYHAENNFKRIFNRTHILRKPLNTQPYNCHSFENETAGTLLQVIPHAILNYIIDRFDQSQPVIDAIRTYRSTDENFAQKLERERVFYNRVIWWEESARAANGLKVGFAKLEESRDLVVSVLSDINLSDHGINHQRRVDDLIQLLFENSPEIKFESKNPEINSRIRDVVDALALFSFGHDFIQAANMAAVKKYKGTGLQLDYKAGHSEGAAALIMALAPIYAKQRNIELPKAERICKIAARMFLPHDSELIKKILVANTSADAEKYKNKGQFPTIELANDYNDGKIDLDTLSPKQIIQLCAIKSSKNINNWAKIGLESKYGLPPEIESALKTELIALNTDDKPILPELTIEEDDCINNGTYIAKVADMIDMVAPFNESMGRKLNVQRSTKRTFLPKRSVIGSYEVITSLKENDVESDTERVLFEFSALMDIMRDTGLSDSDFINTYVNDIIGVGLLQFEQFGNCFMSGYTSLLEIVDVTYKKMLEVTARKVIHKLRVGKFDNYFTSGFEHLTLNEAHDLVTEIIQRSKKSHEIIARSQQVIDNILREQQDLFDKIELKPDAGILYGDGYSDLDMHKFKILLTDFKDLMLRNYNIHDFKRFEKIIAGGGPPMGYWSYHSTAYIPWEMPVNEWTNKKFRIKTLIPIAA